MSLDLDNNRKLKCAILRIGTLSCDEESVSDIVFLISLKVGYTQEEYESFLNKLSEIDKSNDGFELIDDSIVWYEDGCWSTYEEDWEMPGIYYWTFHHAPPKIPDELRIN